MIRARNADHAARTSERFVYSSVKITRLYDYQTWKTISFRNSRGAQWFAWLCFSSDTDWLGGPTPNCFRIIPPKFKHKWLFFSKWIFGFWFKNSYAKLIWMACMLLHSRLLMQNASENMVTFFIYKRNPFCSIFLLFFFFKIVEMARDIIWLCEVYMIKIIWVNCG